MKAQVIYSSPLKSGTSKKSGRPYEGYFVELLVPDSNGDLRVMNRFIDRASLPAMPKPDAMLDIVCNFNGFIESVTVLEKETPFMIRG